MAASASSAASQAGACSQSAISAASAVPASASGHHGVGVLFWVVAGAPVSATSGVKPRLRRAASMAGKAAG
jgi:hypothetical protein